MKGAPLNIVRQTDRYVVVDKPSGLLSVPGKGEANQDCVATRVREMFPQASGPLVVHRLDMDTSGLMVLALDAAAQRDMSMQFEGRSTCKRYIAIVDGVMESASGEVDLPMRLDVNRRPLQIVDHQQGKASLTRWRVLSCEGECTRIELEPVTGRTHQLRVHMAAIGHAILGDPLYGEQPRTREMAPRLLLHASVLEFNDPATRQRVRAESVPSF